MSDVLAVADVNARAIQREAEKARNAARNLARAKSEKGVQQHLARVESACRTSPRWRRARS